MSTFRVGQWVKVVSPGTEFYGLETRVRRVGLAAYSPSLNALCSVETDIPHRWRNSSGDGQFAVFLPSQLEPLTPPKAQELTTWESMPCTRDGKYRQEQYA